MFCNKVTIYSFHTSVVLNLSILLPQCSYFEIFIYFLIYVYECLLECLCTTCIQCPQKPEEGVKSPETRVADNCERLCGCSESNPDPLEE